jgi:magnesium chelatase family protein
VKYKELRAPSSAEDSAKVRERVMEARKRQAARYAGEKSTYANAQMAPKLIRKYCAIGSDGEKLLETAITRLGLSARAHDRILKVARTIGFGRIRKYRDAAFERRHSIPHAGQNLLGLISARASFS